MSVRRLLPALLLLALTGCGDAPGALSQARLHELDELERETLTEATHMAQRVLPSAAERRWEEIDWQATYADGLKASADQQKPLMLWVMNGHPLGCT